VAVNIAHGYTTEANRQPIRTVPRLLVAAGRRHDRRMTYRERATSVPGVVVWRRTFGPSPERVATGCGYVDQAHLTRKVHALAGITPTGLLRELGLR